MTPTALAGGNTAQIKPTCRSFSLCSGFHGNLSRPSGHSSSSRSVTRKHATSLTHLLGCADVICSSGTSPVLKTLLPTATEPRYSITSEKLRWWGKQTRPQQTSPKSDEREESTRCEQAHPDRNSNPKSPTRQTTQQFGVAIENHQHGLQPVRFSSISLLRWQTSVVASRTTYNHRSSVIPAVASSGGTSPWPSHLDRDAARGPFVVEKVNTHEVEEGEKPQNPPNSPRNLMMYFTRTSAERVMKPTAK